MASLDSFSIAILLGAVLVMAGILSSLVALRFGAPLLLVFLGLGIVAGEAGPGGLAFNDVGTTYLVGSVALALILFDGGLKTKFQNIKTVLAPSIMLATVGVLLTVLIFDSPWYGDGDLADRIGRLAVLNPEAGGAAAVVAGHAVDARAD